MGTNQELALDFVASCQLIKRDVSPGRSGGIRPAITAIGSP